MSQSRLADLEKRASTNQADVDSGAVPVIAPTAPEAVSVPSVVHVQARLPNGVAIDVGDIDVRQVGQVIEALGRLRCSGSTKG